MEELEQKLNRLTDVVASLSQAQARTAENNAKAFAGIQATFRDVLGLIQQNAEAIAETRQAIAETRAIADSNARVIQALADDRD